MFLGAATGGPVWAHVASSNDAIKEANLGPKRHSSRRVSPVAERAETGVAMKADNTPVDPNRLLPEQASKLLSAAAKVRVPLEQIATDLESGAPQNSDGTINLVQYAAWLIKEMGRGE